MIKLMSLNIAVANTFTHWSIMSVPAELIFKNVLTCLGILWSIFSRTHSLFSLCSISLQTYTKCQIFLLLQWQTTKSRHQGFPSSQTIKGLCFFALNFYILLWTYLMPPSQRHHSKFFFFQKTFSFTRFLHQDKYF